jgi:hypothetical protein
VLTWTTYLLAGLAVGRANLRGLGTQARLLVLGVLLAVGAKVLSSALLDAVGGEERLAQTAGIVVRDALERGLFGTTPASDWRWLVVSSPHSGTTLDLVHTVGTSFAVLGACLLLARVLPRLLLLPFAAAGSMTLTLYTAHVLSLSAESPFLTEDRLQLWLTQVVLALAFATLWRTTIGRGPLEAVSSYLDRTARQAAAGRRVLQR